MEELIAQSSFYDGYIREKAVRKLVRFSTGEELEPLLLRLNDWVEPIRLLARDAVAARLTPEYAGRWLHLARTISRVLRGSRADHSWLKIGLRELLQRPECLLALTQATRHEDPFVQRLAWQELLATHPIEHPLWEQALDNSGVSQYAARALASTLPAEALASLTRRRLNKKPASLEAILLAKLAERDSVLARPVLEAALFSSGATLRQYARFYLSKNNPEFDAAADYRKALKDAPGRAVFAGLAETGGAEDVPLVLTFLGRWPAEALSALARLSFPEALPYLLQALESESPQLRRVARDGLRDHASEAMERARAIAFDSTRSDAMRANAYRVLLALPHYSKISFILRGLDTPWLQLSAQDALEHWRIGARSVFTRPTSSEIMVFKQALIDCRSLDKPTRRDLMHLLSGFVS